MLYGGAGNDTIVLNAGNIAALVAGVTGGQLARVDGGSGIDTLSLAGGGVTLDLTAIANQGASTPGSASRLESIERIDLTGSGDNALTLALKDVLDMAGMNSFNNANGWADGTYNLAAGGANGVSPEQRHQLVVDRNSGDTVTLSDGANWTNAGTVTNGGNTYSVFNHNAAAAQLLIDDAVTVVPPTTYNWSALTDGQSIAFNPAADVLAFDDASIPAAALGFAFTGSAPLTSTFTFGGKSITLQTDFRALTTTNLTFADGSLFLVGDNTTGVAGDDGANTLTGGNGDDALTGLGGDDSMAGGAGNDDLDGGAGNDTLDGGIGTDTAVYSGLRSQYQVTLQADGSLRVADQRSGAPDGTDTVSNVELFQFTDATYTAASVPTAGDDTLTGGAGDDTLNGGAGVDTVSYSNSTGGVNVNLESGLASDGFGGTDTLIGIEDVVGSSQADIIVGNGGANDLNGAVGDDSLGGGAGNDTLTGGAGNDTLAGGADVDTVSYSDSTGAVNVNLESGQASDGFGGTDTLSGFENAVGGSAADTLIGNSIANVLDGGLGTDTMQGGAGDDTYYVDNADDAVIETSNSALALLSGPLAALAAGSLEGITDTVVAAINFSLANVAFVENLTLSNDPTATESGVLPTEGTGNELDNVLTGNDLSNTLTGLAGNDTIDGGTNTDTAVYGGSRSQYQVTLQADGSLSVADQRSDVPDGTDTVSHVELFQFTDGTYTAESVSSKTANLLVYDWKSHTLLDGVSIGDGSHNGTTDASGSTSFTGITSTSLELTASRGIPGAETTLTSQAVNLQDAIAILKMIVGLDVNGAGRALSPYQSLAADYNGNGTVGLTDAIDVLKHVVGLPAPDPVWRFVNEIDLTIPGKVGLNPGTLPATIGADMSAATPVHVGLVGILNGDVDGSFAGAPESQHLDRPYFDALTSNYDFLQLSQFGVYAT